MTTRTFAWITPGGGGVVASRSLRCVLCKAGFVLAAIAATAGTCGKSPTTPSTAAARSSGSTSVAPAGSTTYYVSPSGDDANPGTQAQPFLTIQHAVDVVNPGETVVVADGTYTGSGAGTACASSNSRPVVCLTRGGTSSQWVTIQAQNALGAKIDGQSHGANYGFDFLAGASYIRISGFEVFGMGTGATGDAAGFVLYSGGNNVVITRNEIHDVGRVCTDTTNGQSGIFIAVPNVTVDSNRIHDIGRFAPGENGCRPSSGYYANHDHGIYVNGNSTAAGANGTTIVNNIFWNDARGWPIQVYPGTVANLSVLNNTFAGANPFASGQIIVAASTSNLRIVNNVFSQPLDAGIFFYSGTHSGMTVANNLSSGPLATSTPSGASFDANLEGVDAQLNGSFQPGATAPGIDRGLSLAEVAVDIIGTRRPQGGAWDIGAYEFVKAALTAPARLLSFAPRDAAPAGGMSSAR